MNGWPPNHVNRLKDLWAEGHSCSQIANTLAKEFSDARYSRNAIIGKSNRMGLAGRARAAAPAKMRYATTREERKTAAAKAVPKMRVEPAAPAQRADGQDRRDSIEAAFEMAPPARQVDEAPGFCTILTLGAHMCKWPIGDPQADNFTLCGKRKGDGPYCGEHSLLARAPDAGRKKPSGNELARSLRRYL